MMKSPEFQITPSSRSRKGCVVEERMGWHQEIALIRFDAPECPVNSLSFTILRELEQIVEELETNLFIDGVVFASTRGSVFLAGADIRTLEMAWGDDARMEEFLSLGQRVFARIAALKVPTVAAIHGACIGGGYELALACRYRIATPDAETRIGLPETRLGLIPAWGGSTRLPRLIGVPAALRLITRGRVLSAPEALKAGLIDQMAPMEKLLEAAAIRIGKDPSRTVSERALWKDWWGKFSMNAAGGRLLAAAKKQIGENYPAAIRAAEVIVGGAGESLETSLASERRAVQELARDERCQNLFRLFRYQEQARRLARNAAREVAPARTVAVVGAGVMGAGLAQWLSSRGIHVILRDVDEQRLGEGMGRVFLLYRQAVRRGKLSSRDARKGIDRISPTLSSRVLSHADWVIEAASELSGLKQRLFHELDRLAGASASFASNTSALPIRDMADATSHPEKVVGLHFFNPIHRMPLVEVILPRGTAIAEKALALVHQIGKVPIIVSDSPGFLVNRVLTPYLLEAIRGFDEGMSAWEIDQELVRFGMPMGPLQLLDEVGLDVALHVGETLFRAWPERFVTPPLLMKMVEGGLLGRKSGRGFYDYPNEKIRAPWKASHYRRRSGVRFDIGEFAEKLILTMINEAALCLDEGIVPTAGEVDLGMVLGAGFAPYRGGPLRYADTMGAETIVRRMEKLELEPCDLLRKLAATSGRFYEERTAAA